MVDRPLLTVPVVRAPDFAGGLVVKDLCVLPSAGAEALGVVRGFCQVLHVDVPSVGVDLQVLSLLLIWLWGGADALNPARSGNAISRSVLRP
uniref:Uncharacterized protein n=1 Tax=Myoviridae sp. ctisV53 TaxID=2825156 RepID=A0A8S5PLH2_9CAUD|nr:MAG TPA: hypothetical protein [Myoviridae sp. ctisV53]DAE49476.1 MAG TPA: hypothetical protein [Bacteriophage sp.]